MVTLNRIYTRTGDSGDTALGSGTRLSKDAARIEAYGTVDEANATLGLARQHTKGDLDAALSRIQNDLFDLGADLCVPADASAKTPLRMTDEQVSRLEREIDTMNAALAPLRSFVLPGGSPAAAYLHLARTVVRRAERRMVTLSHADPIGAPALRYINRLSDHLFVAARAANAEAGRGDTLWVPGANR
jgi:cob(I)alamin adenosyltransferase